MATREKRTPLTMFAAISDGSRVYEGIVINVSRDGLMMKEIPEKFDFYAERYTAVISQQDKHFKFFLAPRWSKTTGIFKEIGFRIISPPLEWIRFVNKLLGEEAPLPPSHLP